MCHLQGREEAGALCPTGHHVVSDTQGPGLVEVGGVVVADTENLLLLGASTWSRREQRWRERMQGGFGSELTFILIFQVTTPTTLCECEHAQMWKCVRTREGT